MLLAVRSRGRADRRQQKIACGIPLALGNMEATSYWLNQMRVCYACCRTAPSVTRRSACQQGRTRARQLHDSTHSTQAHAAQHALVEQ
jgi:hypothetical protein